MVFYIPVWYYLFMKKLGCILFLFLNLLLTPASSILLFYLIVLFISFEKYSNGKIVWGDNFFIVFLLCILLVFFIFKLCIFPLIYILNKNNLYIHNFFEKIAHNQNFRNKVLVFACITDIIIILLFSAETFLYSIKDLPFVFIVHSLFGLGGVFICYLSLIIWFKIRKHKINCKNV